MGRTRKALTGAAFAYVQIGLSLVSGVVLLPFILRRVGPRSYGLWLASGELVGYVGMLDLGVFAVLPWLVAEANGREDRAAVRRLLSGGVAVGAWVGLGCVCLIGLVWIGASWRHAAGPRLTGADRWLVGGPLVLLLAAVALSSPLKAFNAAVVGLQDNLFNGLLALGQSALAIALTVGLLRGGAGLYALAAALAVPAVTGGVAGLLRLRSVAPGLFRHWPAPSARLVGSMLAAGLGAWLSGFGVQLFSASAGLVLASLGRPEWAAVFVCTSRVAAVLMQMCWVLPDSGLVGLAELHGTGRSARVADVTEQMIKLHLLLAGGVACAALAVNPGFVRWWVGAPLFGGMRLNAVLAVNVLALSAAHGLVAPAAVIGHRMKVGVATLAQGVLHVALAVPLTRAFGLTGLAAAAVVSNAVTTLPAGLYLARAAVGLSMARLLRGVLVPWAIRFAPVAIISALLGRATSAASLGWVAFAGVALGLTYLWWMRPFYRHIPVGPRLRKWLVYLRMLPADPATGAAGGTQVLR